MPSCAQSGTCFGSGQWGRWYGESLLRLPANSWASRHPAFWGWACRFTPPPFAACLVREETTLKEKWLSFFQVCVCRHECAHAHRGQRECALVRGGQRECALARRGQGECALARGGQRTNLAVGHQVLPMLTFVFDIGSPLTWRLPRRLDWLASEVQGPTYLYLLNSEFSGATTTPRFIFRHRLALV